MTEHDKTDRRQCQPFGIDKFSQCRAAHHELGRCILNESHNKDAKPLHFAGYEQDGKLRQGTFE